MQESEDDNTRQIVIVMGMHRSGTSAIALLNKNLGIYFGKNLIEKIDGINSDGFWEDKTVVAINEQILTLLDATWYSVQSLPEKWWEKPELETCYQAAHQWQQAILDDRSVAGVKDPRFCRLLPFWLKVFSQAGISVRTVFIYRHPASVAASLGKRDGLSKDYAYLLWLRYVIDALEAIPASSSMVVRYEELLYLPSATTEILLDNVLVGISGLKRIRYKRVANSTISLDKDHFPAPAGSLVSGSAIEKIVWSVYKDLKESTSENIQSITKKYRSEFNEFLKNGVELASILCGEIDTHIQINRQLTLIGEAHEIALKTISKKDQIYDRSVLDMEKKISGNKAYIRKCQLHIRKQDELLKALGKKAEITENLQRAVTDREKKIAENVAYINKCEDRIREQDQIILQLKNATFIWPIWHGLKRMIKWMGFR